MEQNNELIILNEILNFQVKEIPENTRFWMIRTKKGYFYDEFVGRGYVALAWNEITKDTDFSDQSNGILSDTIMLNYPEIKRPTTVINKCKSFISDVKVNDVLVIPNAGSSLITFAYAGEYYEDETKTTELEKLVISRIENKDVVINEVTCPYKKRRHITVIRTVRSEEINYSLYRAILNNHGISNLDNYALYILNSLYNIYSYKNDLNIIFNVGKKTPIGPRELSGLLYGTTEYLCNIVDESNITTQVNLNSPGPVLFTMVDIFDKIKDNYIFIFGLLIVVGGGNFLTFKLPGISQVIKDILTLPTSIKKTKAETEIAETEAMIKKCELYDKIKSSGINPEDLKNPIDIISKTTKNLEVSPIENNIDTDSHNNVIIFSDFSQEDDIE